MGHQAHRSDGGASPDEIAAAAALALLLGLLVFSVRRRQAQKRRLPDDWAVQQRAVFNVDERRFYRQICAALPGCVVLSKLPLVRLCQPLRPREVRYWYELLGAIHVSFVIGVVSWSCPGSSSKPSRPDASESSER